MSSLAIRVLIAGLLASGMEFELPNDGKSGVVYCSVPAEVRIDEKDDKPKSGSVLGDKLKEAMTKSGISKKLAVRIRDDTVDIDRKTFYKKFDGFLGTDSSSFVLADALQRVLT